MKINFMQVLFLLISLPMMGQGPVGYMECEPEQNFKEPTNVAFGNNGNYKYLFNQVGPIVFSRGQFFGGDSSAKEERCWYQTISKMDVETPSAKLADAFTKLKKHLTGESVLGASQIMRQDSIIQANISAIGIKKEIIEQSFDLVSTYENTAGPLFDINGKKIMLPRETQAGMEIHYALFYIMDAITRTYSAAKLEEFPEIYEGAMFKSSEYFPGKVAPPENSNNVYSVKVKASQAPNWGTPIYFHRDAYSRRPTGAYVAPGTIVKIKVPSSVVNKGYTIRVGTHFWDLRYRNRIARLDRATIIYPVVKETIIVGSPLGGNIYFEVPEGKNDGIITLELTGAVRSPYFSTRDYNKTSLEDWRNTERHHPGAWADFESDKFLIQVPTSWIYDFDDPETMLNNYDIAMDAVSDLLGKPRVQGTHVMFRQLDVIMRAGVHAPGYPEINVTYDPTEKTDGKGNQTILQSPVKQPWVIFHEMGHSHVPSFFVNETESIVNLLHVAVANDGFGMELDSAFGWSISNRFDVDLDMAAINLMVTDPFRNNEPLNRDRMSYQHRGHGKYVDVVRLFGWDALKDMYKKVNEDYNRGIIIEKTHHPTDDRILRMSVTAGADLRPLLHFWGRPPDNNKSLSDAIAAAGLSPSKEIFETLEHYKTIIPKTLTQARAHAKLMFPQEGHPSINGHDLERDMAFIYNSWNEDYALHSIQQIELIQKLYFPESWLSNDTTKLSENGDGTVILTPKPGPEPKINGPRLFGVRPGRPFIYRIPCTGKRPMTFEVENLPKGLIVNANTGIINGNAPREPGDYIVRLKVQNDIGMVEKEFRIVVGEKLALTPPMGWNSWYIHYSRVTGKVMREAANMMVESGMADYGYMYVNIDDCWMRIEPVYYKEMEKRLVGIDKNSITGELRDENGNILPNDNFPDMKSMTDYIHAKGLRAGIYTSPGPRTCQRYAGSYMHEQQDARQYAAWGFDFLKYDWCSYNMIYKERLTRSNDKQAEMIYPYQQMSDILKSLDRDIVYNLCQYGMGDVWTWGGQVGNSWRTTGDLGLEEGNQLPGFYHIGMNNARLWEYNKPGAWNDPDYILIGWVGDARGQGIGKETTLTGHEQYSYMSMWSLMAAPLFFSGDMAKLDDFTLNILCNSEVIDINQDALGKQARIVVKNDETLILAKPMEDGSLAVGMFNLAENQNNVTVQWDELKIKGDQKIRDVWRQKDLGEINDMYSAQIARHGVMLVRLWPSCLDQ